MNSKFYSCVKIFIVILEEEKIRQAQKDIPHPEARRKNDFRQKHLNNTLQHVNEYVTQLVDLVDEAGSLHYKKKMRVKPPVKIPTPYGGRLIWTLPGKTKIVCHLKHQFYSYGFTSRVFSKTHFKIDHKINFSLSLSIDAKCNSV